jgi:hypothetical protein
MPDCCTTTAPLASFWCETQAIKARAKVVRNELKLSWDQQGLLASFLPIWVRLLAITPQPTQRWKPFSP